MKNRPTPLPVALDSAFPSPEQKNKKYPKRPPSPSLSWNQVEFKRESLRGFSLRGFGDVPGFPFCGGKKGLRLPLAMGKRV